MTPAIQSICVTIANAAVIVAVLIWSGSQVGDSLYKKHIIEFDRILVPTANLERANNFYTKVLGLPTTNRATADSATGLTTAKQLQPFIELVLSSPALDSGNLERQATTPTDLSIGQVIAIRVKNDIRGLHRKIAERTGRLATGNPERKLAAVDTPVLPAELGGESFANLPPGTVSDIISIVKRRIFAIRDFDGNTLVFYQK